ncbi:hypothetical protein Y032_0115g524 [Ancylostoma ceylanicum]|uniref:Uncharacterized protein n=1 Tax=Ancylostoma ceylanicum TaxID=53326 RepID=A0A016TD39_9BILA|nr:hypothetical protein Y032_0115g524 [Ancylostoma ceylanicum]
MQDFTLNETTDGERSSVRSSEDGASGSPGGDDRERLRLLQKIDLARERLKVTSLERERDVEEFLMMTHGSECQKGADNPQMARLKQHFEKKNKRHTSELEHLQRKLANYEQRLAEIENGIGESGSRATVISTVGQERIYLMLGRVGARRLDFPERTGANLKGMTETVISAPLELAQRLKSTFGSADNVNEPGEGANSDLRIGHSKFYASSDYGSPSQATTSRYASRKSDSLPAHASLLKTSTPARCRVNDSDTSALVDDSELGKGDRGEQASDSLLLSPFALSAESSEMPPQLLEDLRGLRYLMTKMGDQINRIETRLDTELAYVTRALEEERGKYMRLETTMNETIELHQAEFQALKQEQKGIANRLDYQYNDRFKRVEESVESVQNHMVRMENSIKDTLDIRLSGPAWGNAVFLSSANIVVEFLKIVLYLVATVLDLFLPYFGSRLVFFIVFLRKETCNYFVGIFGKSTGISTWY